VYIPLNELDTFKVKDIPENVVVKPCELNEHGKPVILTYGHDVEVYSDGTVFIEFQEYPKYYRGFLPVEDYIEAISIIARNLGFKIGEKYFDDDLFGVNLEIHVDPCLTVRKALESSVEKFFDKVIEFEERLANEVLRIKEQILKDIL